MRHIVGLLTILFWASVALVVALVGLSWVASGVLGERSFLRWGATLVGLTMVSSAFLMWHEFRANPAEEDGEWTARAWLYATAFGLSFFLSCYFLPVLYFS